MIVSGIVPDPDHLEDPLLRLRAYALTLFDIDLVGRVTEPGHNFRASFCIHPTGSAPGRDDYLRHAEGLRQLTHNARIAGLDFYVVEYRTHEDGGPAVTAHHGDNHVVTKAASDPFGHGPKVRVTNINEPDAWAT